MYSNKNKQTLFLWIFDCWKAKPLQNHKIFAFLMPLAIQYTQYYSDFFLLWWWAGIFRNYLSIDCSETKENDKWPFYDHFRPFFGQLHDFISQNWGSDGHFEVLNRSKPWLIQKLWLKMQIFPFPFFCDIVEKNAFVFFVFFVFYLHFVS